MIVVTRYLIAVLIACLLGYIIDSISRILVESMNYRDVFNLIIPEYKYIWITSGSLKRKSKITAIAFRNKDLSIPITENNTDKNYQLLKEKAREYIKKDKWIEAREILNHRIIDHPYDDELLFMLLSIETKNFSDFRILDLNERKRAAEYWARLEILGCILPEMVEYGTRRRCYLRRSHIIKKIVLLGYLSFIVLLMLLSLSVISGESAPLLLISGIIYLPGVIVLHLIYRKFRYNPTPLKQHLSVRNPFFI